MASHITSIAEVKANVSLWYRIHVFLYDLRNFRERADSHTRLETVVDVSYIGLPYFKPEEAEMLKSMMFDGKTLGSLIEVTLQERLEKRMKKRVESGDYRVCAAHDVAPVLEKVFGINPKLLAKNKTFLELIDRSGLFLKDGDSWTGLVTKRHVNPVLEKKKKKKKTKLVEDS